MKKITSAVLYNRAKYYRLSHIRDGWPMDTENAKTYCSRRVFTEFAVSHGLSRVSLRLGPLAGDGLLLSFGHFPLQGELHSAALTTHCVVIHYRLDRQPLQRIPKQFRFLYSYYSRVALLKRIFSLFYVHCSLSTDH